MVPPGQLCVSVGSSSSLSICFPPPPVFVPFCPCFSSFLLSCLYLFMSLYLPFGFFCYLLLLFDLLRLPFCFLSVTVVAFLLPCCYYFSGRVRMFVFLFLSLFYTPRVACEPAICENLRILLCVSFLDFLLSIASLPELNLLLSLFSLGFVIFSILISIFRR